MRQVHLVKNTIVTPTVDPAKPETSADASNKYLAHALWGGMKMSLETGCLIEVRGQ